MIDKGAHFYRCDLQVHTPRDLNWTGIDRISDPDRRTYAGHLVLACRDRGIQGVAITDHHDMAFAEYIRRAAAEETDSEGKPLAPEQKLVVFPGMELISTEASITKTSSNSRWKRDGFPSIFLLFSMVS